MIPIRPTLALVLLAAAAPAQLADLQPGRNFPTAQVAFGAERSENVDMGDIDRDGDLDVAIANGGDGGPADNQLHVNLGGLQGGDAGTFADGTIVRLPDQVPERSRDIELVDWDGDFDLDLFDACRGTSTVPAVQRVYTNQGGLQLGTIGTYTEDTNRFWGQLVSIPPFMESGVQDGQGPFFHDECNDAEFADLDDDGDLDLLLNNAGIFINGTGDTLIFLNDGAGRFDELWPWANAGADIKMHTMDADILDLDGDFDLDVVVSSRDTQSRVFRNNWADDGWTSDPFTDVTQAVLLDTGAGQGSGGNTYEVEYGDLDGDDDFDLWFVNYQNFSDRILINDGSGAFTKETGLIKGDPNMDENEADLLDYDADGDLDVMMANFSGTNHLYQSGLAQGLTPAQGLYHRTGTTSSGSLAGSPETPASGNGGTTQDAEAADMDGDGDPDLLLVNDGLQNNRYWENVLGLPDTHAPVLRDLTVQGDKADGSPTPIHVRVMDNEPWYGIQRFDARLVWSVDGGPEACQPLLAQGGQLFRGEIPAGLSGAVSYRVEVTDSAGNLSVSPTTTYQQSGGSPDVWLPVDCGTEGVAGRPLLVIEGSGVGGEEVFLQLVDGAPTSLCLFLASLSSTPVLFKGGLLYPVPWDVEVFLATDTGGMVNLLATWPAGLPAGTETWFQCAVADPQNPTGAALSNAVRGTQP